MIILPSQIEHSGPGVDLSNQPDGLSVTMAGVDKDFVYSANRVTLIVDLYGYRDVKLAFDAREFGDEPHFPKNASGVVNHENLVGFGPVADFDFDGVSVSADGEDWYEVRGLRDLATRPRHIEIDLDAALLACSLEYTHAFQIRLTQFDNGPIAWDGIALSGIEISGEFVPPLLELPMDDNAAGPTVRDASGHGDLLFLDPGGNPNTAAHSVAGPHGEPNRALAFDGVDDRIALEASFSAALGAGEDFTIAFWVKFPIDPLTPTGYVLWGGATYGTAGTFSAMTDAGASVEGDNRFWLYFRRSDNSSLHRYWNSVNTDAWHHYAVTRQGDTLKWYRDGVLAKTDTNPLNAESFDRPGMSISGEGSRAEQFAMSDFRLYDYALSDAAIAALA